MDAFEIRIRFIELIKRLTSAQSSIQKLVSYAVKHGPKCSDDLWQCLIEECERAGLNARINLFYALDGLLEAASESDAARVYLALVQRDLEKLVQVVVPPTKEGVLNSLSAQQILKSWKTRRVIDPLIVEQAEKALEGQKVKAQEVHQNGNGSSEPSKPAGLATKFSRNDILRRIEDDRERHKRLRERAWVLPVPSPTAGLEHIARPALMNLYAASLGLPVPSASTSQTTPSPFSPHSPAPTSSTRSSAAQPQQQQQHTGSQAPQSATAPAASMLDPVDVEFEQLWEKEWLKSDGVGITQEDLDAMRAETDRAKGLR